MLKQKQTLRDIKNACDDNNTAAPSKLFFELILHQKSWYSNKLYHMQ